MLLQRLCEYAERQLALPPQGYQEQPIRYVLRLNAAGQFPELADTSDPATPRQKRGTSRLAPALNRTSGVSAKLLADKSSYALGPAPGSEPTRRQLAEHAAFVELVGACARATGNPDVAVIHEFLTRGGPATVPLPADFAPGEQIIYCVEGRFPTDAPDVRAFWAARQFADAGAEMPCIACGNRRPALEGHPVTIKRVPGGQTSGNYLISANAKAFESYGLERSLIAPTCASCAEKYATALNALLVDDASRVRVGNTAYVFWTAEPSGFQPARLLTAPDQEEVAELMRSHVTGRVGATDIDEMAFYALGLSGSGARIAIRTWIDATVGAAQRRLARYFALQAIEDAWGEPAPSLPLRFLTGATVRDPLKDDPPAAIADALVGLALAGEPLPDFVLARVAQRCRASQGVTRERAALIKMALGSRDHWSDERTQSMSGLDASNHDPAYLCGRLLAELNEIQRQALGKTNATVIDKFYGSASSAPASVFGNLLDNAQNHLSKLRKARATEAAANALDARLMEILDELPEFPRTLTMPEQAMFALGFYHQRAADRRAARERREARDAAGEPDAADEAVSDDHAA
ncbi:MAG: type I-C CRISPR-associated protein Cas8c/Csd1 [Thermomicrobiales bacterium]|nr:type I-C CRISPR-associated protein Cas8c/Csd1 [Thermomicrobiales bacterium]